MAEAGYINPLSPDATKWVDKNDISVAGEAVSWKGKYYAILKTNNQISSSITKLNSLKHQLAGLNLHKIKQLVQTLQTLITGTQLSFQTVQYCLVKVEKY